MSEYSPTGQIRSVIETLKDHSWSIKVSGYILVLGMVLKFGNGYFFASETASQSIDRIIIISCLLVLIIGGIYRETQIKRDRRFASIQQDSHLIHHRIRDLQTYLDHVLDKIETQDEPNLDALADKESVAKTALTQILDNFARCFSLVTGTHCRATVKGVFESNGEYFVYTIGRDSDSQVANEESDARRTIECSDPLEKNEDFAIITDSETEDRWFFDGFLPTRPDYLNSHDPSLKERRKLASRTFRTRLFSRADWRLPYVSTIVWPIQQKPNQSLTFPEMGCIGFLAIDSNRKDAFSERFDPYFGAGIADSLFHVIDRLAALSETVEILKEGEENA